MPVDSSHFSPHFDSIFSSKYFILKALKRSFDPITYGPTGGRIKGECVNITLIVHVGGTRLSLKQGTGNRGIR